MNPLGIMKMKNAWETFQRNHPKFPSFLEASKNGMLETGSVIEISITNAQGKNISTNVKLTQSDLELFEELKNLR